MPGFTPASLPCAGSGSLTLTVGGNSTYTVDIWRCHILGSRNMGRGSKAVSDKPVPVGRGVVACIPKLWHVYRDAYYS